MCYAAFALLAVLGACDKPPPEQAAVPPRPVRVQAVAFSEPRAAMVLSGTVQARRQAELAFRVGGKIVARPVDLGARVRAGDVIARLDPADLALASEAARSAAEAAAVDAANARAEYQRYAGLGRNSPAFLQSEHDKRATAAAMMAARLMQARLQHALAQSQQNYGTLLADADGVVVALSAEIGQVVAAGQTVAVLARTGETDVLVDVPENRLAELRAVGEVGITPWSDPSQSFVGRVREVAARADPASRTFAVRVAVADRDGRQASDSPSDLSRDLPLGSTATVRLTGPGTGPVAVLPAAALADQDGAPSVWVLDTQRGRAMPRPVSVAGYRGDHVAIRSGVLPGELVVTAGVTQLYPELPVVAWAGAQR